MKTFNKTARILFFMIFIGMFLCAAGLWVEWVSNTAYKVDFILGLGVSAILIWMIVMMSGTESHMLHKDRKLIIQEEILLIFIVILVAFLLRCVSIRLMKTVQISDFGIPNEVIRTFSADKNPKMLDNYRNYYARYPAWFPYMRFIHGFYNLFCGGEINAEAAKYLNAVLNALTCGGVYYVSRHFFFKKAALTAGLLYACSPSMVLWVNVMSPDHITMFLLVLQAIVWYWMWEKKDNIKYFLPLIVLHTIVCVLVNWFKPFIILFWLVFIIFLICANKILEKKRFIGVLAAYTLSFMLSFSCSSKLLTVWVENYIQQEVTEATWLYIYVGVVTDEAGNLDSARANEEVVRVMKEYDDTGQQMKVLKEMALEEIKHNIRKIPRLLFNKYKVAVNNEGMTWSWANTNEQNGYNTKLQEILWRPYHFYANGYYFWILLMVVGCGILQLFPRHRNDNALMPALVIAGFLAIQILSGVQARYKLILMPFYMMLAAYGIEELRKAGKESDDAGAKNEQEH